MELWEYALASLIHVNVLDMLEKQVANTVRECSVDWSGRRTIAQAHLSTSEP